ncbi:MAG: LuxR C-terminal-related transcriptional regulator [Defluviitaleaceae bacterium]|nr:LuxR C-terminal-related transcriptional regulator [Defluviitaleaceae bacterium]
MDSTGKVMLERRNLIRTFNKLKNDRVISVCAPAGYGKTVAVRQWLDKDARAKAFVSLDEYDNNLAGFCAKLCVALYTCQPQNKTLYDIISHDSFRNAPDESSILAVAALSGRKQTALVIDDLHMIHSSELLKFLLIFIKRLPRNFSVILISRHDLPGGFSDLWLKGHIVSIDASQLLFNKTEVKALCEMRGNRITKELSEDINKANGWAIGINAFLLSGNISFDKAYGYLDDFIRENIWEKLDDATRDFMIRTAGLRELTPSACEAMTGVGSCHAFLTELVRRGVFITQTREEVFHYHHFFKQFLGKKADEQGEEFVHSLLEKEGNWHLLQNDFFSAMDCFVRCKNHEGIDRCYDFLETASIYNSYASERLVQSFKHHEIQIAAKKYPRLLFMLFWCAFVEGRADDAAFYIDEFYAKWSEIASRYPSSSNNIIYVRLLDFRLEKQQLLDEIATLADTHDFYLATPARLGFTMNMLQLHRGILDLSDLAIGNVVENVTFLRSRIAWLFGEGVPMMADLIVSGLLYEQGHLDKSHKYALNALSNVKDIFPADLKCCAAAALVMVLDALEGSDSEEATRAFESLMIETSSCVTANFNAFTARRKIAAGNVRAAEDWISEKSNEPTLWTLYISFTTCRAYIATGKYDQAIILLKKILRTATAYNRPLDIIEAHILLTIAYWKKKMAYQNEALEHLETAVSMAFTYGYVQIFINDGAVLSGILHKLKKRIEGRKADANIINFTKMIYLKTRPLSVGANIKSERAVKLTDKQKAVMALLCQGKRYKEVAETLGIKKSTVISHIELIYNKLEVTNLADCVAKVNAMRLHL